MAVYRCEECDSWLDNDYHPCEQHPQYENELICPACMDEMPQEKPAPNFTKLQQEMIKRMENESLGEQDDVN